MARARDRIRVATDAGDFDGFEKIDLSSDFSDVSSLTMTFGNAGTWRSASRVVAKGNRVRVYLNGLLQFTGRFEAAKVPTAAGTGSTVQVVARTRLADAKVASASPSVRFKDTSVKDFILALFEPLGYSTENFLFAAAAERDLATGKKQGFTDPVDLEPLKADQLKINPPETIWEAAARVLKRHRLMMWDASDGRVLVGRPDDTQAPLYSLIARQGPASITNNVLKAERITDWTEVPSEIWVVGGTKNSDLQRATLRGVSVDLDLLAVAAATGEFNRKIVLPSDGVKTQVQANAQARRELAARSRDKDAWSIEVDGWTQWDGQRAVPYAINTTSDVDVECVGAEAAGRYLIAKVRRSYDKDEGATSDLTLYAPGIYDIDV